MIKSMLCNFFQDVNDWVNLNIGTSGVAILITMLAIVACLLLTNIIKAAVGKTKLVIKWGQLLLLILVVVAIVWLCTTF